MINPIYASLTGTHIQHILQKAQYRTLSNTHFLFLFDPATHTVYRLTPYGVLYFPGMPIVKWAHVNSLVCSVTVMSTVSKVFCRSTKIATTCRFYTSHIDIQNYFVSIKSIVFMDVRGFITFSTIFGNVVHSCRPFILFMYRDCFRNV